MAVMVVLALALAVTALAGTAVAVVLLWRAIGGLRASADRAREQMRPMTDELAAEQATLALEADALQRRLDGGLRGARAGHARR